MTLSCDVTSSAQRRDKILFNDRISSLVVVEDGSTVSLSLLGNGADGGSGETEAFLVL